MQRSWFAKVITNVWFIAIVGGVAAAIIAGYVAVDWLGWGESTKQGLPHAAKPLQLTLYPSVVTYGTRKIVIEAYATNLTPNGPVREEFAFPYGGIAGQGTATSQGTFEYTQSFRDDPPHLYPVGSSLRVSITDDSTGATVTGYVQVFPKR